MKPLDVRRRLLSALQADLVGPFAAGVPGISAEDAAASDETLTLPPSRWYLTGFLAPSGHRAPEADDLESLGGELAAGSQTGTDDEGSEQPDARPGPKFPASMGLSVYLPPGSGDFIEALVSYAYYDLDEVATDRDDKKLKAWKRVSVGPLTVRVPLESAALKSGVPVGRNSLFIKGEIRTTQMEGLESDSRVASLFVVNDQAALDKDRDQNFVFQVSLTLKYARGFCARPNRRGEGTGADFDQKVMALLFRDKKEWAVGHNTSVRSPVVEADGHVRTLSTTQLPCSVVPQVDHQTIDGLTVRMEDLGKLDAGGIQTLLRAVDKSDLALALKGASDGLRTLFFSNMSERGGKLLKEDMASMGPVRLKDVDAAQTRMVAVAKDLSARGEIVLSDGKSDDELIY
jgi:hypothetical protein